MTINELIRKVFKDSGLTYDEISQKTGISKSTLHGYASGMSINIHSKKQRIYSGRSSFNRCDKVVMKL